MFIAIGSLKLRTAHILCLDYWVRGQNSTHPYALRILVMPSGQTARSTKVGSYGRGIPGVLGPWRTTIARTTSSSPLLMISCIGNGSGLWYHIRKVFKISVCRGNVEKKAFTCNLIGVGSMTLMQIFGRARLIWDWWRRKLIGCLYEKECFDLTARKKVEGNWPSLYIFILCSDLINPAPSATYGILLHTAWNWSWTISAPIWLFFLHRINHAIFQSRTSAYHSVTEVVLGGL